MDKPTFELYRIDFPKIFRRFADLLERSDIKANINQVDRGELLAIVEKMKTYAWCQMGGQMITGLPEDKVIE